MATKKSLVTQRNNLPKPPFAVGDRGAYIRKACVAVSFRMVEVAEIVVYNFAYDRVESLQVPSAQISTDPNSRGQYYVDGGHMMGGTARAAENSFAWLRNQALQSGATPDAIRILGAIKPFSKKEEASMAEKLKSKASPKKANASALKDAAKAAPVGGKKGDVPKKRGNPEALAKARAARSAGPDTRKIKALVKAKDLTAREGTFRRAMLEDLLSSKTVQEWRDKDSKYDPSCLKFAVDNGIVSVA